MSLIEEVEAVQLPLLAESMLKDLQFSKLLYFTRVVGNVRLACGKLTSAFLVWAESFGLAKHSEEQKGTGTREHRQTPA